MREAAADRIRQWSAVVEGMADGSLAIGTRTPVAGVPAWVTLEVAHGGFATGRLLAEHTEAAGFNEHALGPGRLALLERLEVGAYRIDVPEQGAIPVVLRLLELGCSDEALELLDVLAPWLDRLVFVPPYADPHPDDGITAHVRTVGEMKAALEARRPPAGVVAMNTTLGVWRPLQDRVAGLLAQTVVEERCGGQVPAGWWTSARAVLADAEALVAAHPDARRPRDGRTALGGMLAVLRRAVPTEDERLLAEASRAFGHHVRKRGWPGSGVADTRAREERAHAARPLHADIAKLVAKRLERMAPDRGLADPTVHLGPLQGEEATEAVPAGTPLPSSVRRRVERCKQAPLEELVDGGWVVSLGDLARIAPQVTAAVRSSNLDDPVLRQLVTRIDQAFRKRRGLMLLDWSRQVRMEELPWIQAVEPVRSVASAEQAMREALEEFVLLTFRGFPYTQLPNEMVSEVRALAEQAGLDLPFTEELAADIFMGGFSKKFLRAAEISSRALKGSLYARYYDLPDSWDRRSLVQTCTRRALGDGCWGRTSENGAVIEQALVLTTHNVVPLVEALQLAPLLELYAPAMCDTTYAWFVQRVSTLRSLRGIERLRATKNAAYAWRQLLLWLTYDPRGPEDFLQRTGPPSGPLVPVWQGLVRIARGDRFVDERAGEGRRLYGWSPNGPHWLGILER